MAVLLNNEGHCPMGQNGRIFQWGTAAFVTTGATLELPVARPHVESIVLTPIGAPASDEVLSVNETLTGGVLVVPTGDTVTVTRTGASKTDGLKFAYFIISY